MLGGIDYALGDNVENLVLTGDTASVNGTGNALDDALSGNGGVNQLSGGGGNDVLDGQAGADTLVGSSGDDVFIFDAADLVAAGTYWFGQSGADAVRMGVGESLDLVAMADDRINGIDTIDLGAVGEISLTLAMNDVQTISDLAALRVAGSAADHVTALGVWGQAGDVLIGSDLCHSYASGSAALLVDADISVSFV